MLRCGMVGSPPCTHHMPGRPGCCSGWPSSAPRFSISPAQSPPEPRSRRPARRPRPPPARASPAATCRRSRSPRTRCTPCPTAVTRISGAARVADVVSLSVLGRAVRLFGVRAPQAGDLCPSSEQAAPRPCSEAARGALAARLAANDDIVCRVPPGQRAPVPAAVCHDATGADLGLLLVAEGFALADPTQSYDYFAAEAAARQLRRGLWHYR